MLSPCQDSWTVWNVVPTIVENCKVAALISIHGDPPPLCRFYITSPTLGGLGPPAWAQNTSWYHFMSAHTGQHVTFNSCCHGLRLWWESRVPINILLTTRKCSASLPIKLNPVSESRNVTHSLIGGSLVYENLGAGKMSNCFWALF